jgi:hypothetical protein
MRFLEMEKPCIVLPSSLQKIGTSRFQEKLTYPMRLFKLVSLNFFEFFFFPVALGYY